MLDLCDNQAMEYFKKHPVYLASVHFIGGVGLGILIAHPVFSPHPVRWGVAFIGLAAIGHLYAWISSRA